MKSYMSVVTVMTPERLEKINKIYEDWNRPLPRYNKNDLTSSILIILGETKQLLRRENSAKAIFRWIKKQNFERGTMVLCTNWYVGYADMIITV